MINKGWIRTALLALACAARGAAGEDASFNYTGVALHELVKPTLNDVSRVRPLGDHFRVAAYNVENFTDGVHDEPTRTPEIAARHAARVAENVAKINPDIVLFMEIENTNVLCMLDKSFPDPYPLAYISHLGSGSPEDQKLNLAMLSRVPIERASEIDFGPLKGPGRPARGVLRAIVDLGEGRKLLLYGVHLKSNWGNRERNIAERQHALELLVEDEKHLAESQPGTAWEVMVVGDTNVDPESPNFADDPSFAPLSAFIDLWRGRPLPERVTWARRLGDPTQDFPSVTFDRIFISPDLTNAPWRVGAPQVLQEGSDTNNIFTLPGEGVHISDHYPIFIDLSAN